MTTGYLTKAHITNDTIMDVDTLLSLMLSFKSNNTIKKIQGVH